MKKTILRTIIKLPYTYFVLGFIFLFIGLQTYFNGYQGVDSSFNRCLISLYTNNPEVMSWKETLKISNGNATEISSFEFYSRALSFLNDAVKFLIVAGLLFGVGIGLLLKDLRVR